MDEHKSLDKSFTVRMFESKQNKIAKSITFCTYLLNMLKELKSTIEQNAEIFDSTSDNNFNIINLVILNFRPKVNMFVLFRFIFKLIESYQFLTFKNFKQLEVVGLKIDILASSAYADL